ncbi:MAG: glucokinase [Thermoplasmatales archaeon]|nr:MAG: glucokinase [Thermoplasmatales archaeon]
MQKTQKKKFSYYVLGIDIGGTNTNLGIAGVENSKPFLLFTQNYKTIQLDSLVPAIQKTLAFAKNKYNIEVDFACIGAAGVVSPSCDSAELTNVEWNLCSKELINKTSLNKVTIINDFQTIGYGLNLLDSNNTKDIFQVRSKKSDIGSLNETKIILGAGTGLGKSILTYDKNFNAYIPIPSEGGHADFPAQNNLEMKLIEYVKTLRGISQPISYEELLSGRGLESIYLFIRDTKASKETKYTKDIDNAIDKASLISKYKNLDETCKETFHLFTKFYARCAKNFVLDTLARGGLYIAGGIAAKNKEIFTSKEFTTEFENAYNRYDLLKTIPISVIVNYDVSLYGACYAAMYELLNNKNL